MFCQKYWVYLENIFTSGLDIKKKLPEESKKWDSFDTFFRKEIKINKHKFIYKLTNYNNEKTGNTTVWKTHKETLNNI